LILVDTSIWIDHLRSGDPVLTELLQSGRVAVHPFVIGELALGNLRQRKLILEDLSNLPQTSVATETETLNFIDRHALFGMGIGYVDAHLLAATKLGNGMSLWTRDKRLSGVADRLNLAAYPAV
jgi:predicted nucleic acid-binding protein